MKLAQIVMVGLLLTGCGEFGMNNDDIIRAVKKCNDAGMDVTHLKNVDGSTWKVECVERGRK